MKMFEYFGTTADIGIIAYGKSLEELFENAAKAVFNIMCNIEKVIPKEKKVIEISEEDIDLLFVAWLSSLLAYKDIYNMMFSKFNVKIENKYRLIGEVYGEEVKDYHELKTEVKAITYHNLEIGKREDLWVAKFVVDV